MTDISASPRQALGIGLEEFEYPYPVGFFPVTSDLQSLTMAYMDVHPTSEPNGSTAVLMHGKAFGGYYFLNVVQALTAAGYRVVAPTRSAGASRQNQISTTASNCSPPTRQHSWTTSGSKKCRCSVTPPAG